MQRKNPGLREAGASGSPPWRTIVRLLLTLLAIARPSDTRVLLALAGEPPLVPLQHGGQVLLPLGEGDVARRRAAPALAA